MNQICQSYIRADFICTEKNWITYKLEKIMWTIRSQIDILNYYFTIAWVKLDCRIITEIHRRAAKAATKEFRTATFVPKIA